ncbi:MAG: universal stress protein [Solirubrobacterales bacterium]
MTFEEDNAAMTADRNDFVVVGVDGTDRDADALVLASRLVSALGAPVVIAHAHPYGPLSGLLGDGEHERLLRELAEAIGEQASAHLRDADVTMQLLADTSPARALHRIVADRRAQMLVVGSSVRSRVGLTGPGSISERAIQGSPCPVAIAPLGYATTAPARLSAIGCAFDDDAPARAALEHAARLADACAARLEVTAVFEPISYSPPLDAWTVNGRLRDDLQRAPDRRRRPHRGPARRSDPVRRPPGRAPRGMVGAGRPAGHRIAGLRPAAVDPPRRGVRPVDPHRAVPGRRLSATGRHHLEPERPVTFPPRARPRRAVSSAIPHPA